MKKITSNENGIIGNYQIIAIESKINRNDELLKEYFQDNDHLFI